MQAGTHDHLDRPQDGRLPAIVHEAGLSARYAYEEFFFGRIDNIHTRTAYRRDVDRFLDHVHRLGLALHQVTPKLVRSYLENIAPLDPAAPPLSAPTRKRVLAAIRAFFDAAVTRHAIREVIQVGLDLQETLSTSDVIRLALRTFEPRRLSSADIAAMRAQDGRTARVAP